MRTRFPILIFTLMIFRPANLFCQHVSFTPVYYKSEKSNRGFMGIVQDRLGNIWLSSFDGGIYRYDGSDFIDFQHNDTSSNSISSNNTECIYADSTDIIWIGTFGGGLDRFDPLTRQFTHFRHNDRESSSLANDTIMAILTDREGNFWVGTYGGLDLFDSKAGTFKHYSHNPANRSSLSSNQVRSIYEDHQGTLWIGCGSIFANDGPEEGGLNRFNRSEGSFTSYKHEPGNPNSLETNKVQALLEDSKGNFWVGTSGNGLHMMDRAKGTFTHYYYDSTHPEKLSRPPVNKFNFDHITFINEDILGGIWIGSFLGGINRYDPAAKKITHFGRVMDGAKSLHITGVDTANGYSDYSSWQALFSPDGQIWFTIVSPISGSLFYHASIIRKAIPFYSTDKMGGANTFYDDSDSLLWIGTENGLIKKNRVLQTEKIYVNEPRNPNSLSNNSVGTIRVDKEKNLWLGTSGGGINKYDPVSNHFTRFLFNEKNKSSLSNDTIWSMLLDHQDGLWVGSSNGLDKLDKKSGGFTHFKLENRNKRDHGNQVFCIREDQQGQLWVGALGGLYKVNISSGTVTTVLPYANTTSICVDSKNEVWIGSDTGRVNGKQKLYRLDQNQFVLFADPNRQEIITDLFDIMEDNHQNLWISTPNAILRISDKRDGVRRFGSEYGVHQNGFDLGDNFKARNGKLFFGDSHGYYSFFPEDLKVNGQPRLNFASFKLNEKEVIPAEGGILKNTIWRTEEIRMAHNENNFSFEFSAIDYQGSEEGKIFFMLENYDNDWLTYGNGRRANYFNVPPGNYTLRIKAFSSDGAMSEKSLRIIISPPWWKTWWAYTIFSLMIIGAVRGFIIYRSRKLLAENKLLEEKVAQRTEQLNLSLKELKSTQNQLIQSEKMASLGELTAGIAHEIQNPLNFVNNFSEINSEMIAEMKEEIAKGNLVEIKSLAGHIEENEKKILHHGKRADAIVKGMLQHSRTNSGVKESTDLNKLADEYLRLCYHGLRAKDKSFNVDLQTNYNQNLDKINIISQDIGRVLLNLFNNAFYAVSERKKQQAGVYVPTVEINTRKKDNFIELSVKDNGNGIPKKILDKIFQPFFTTKPTGQGTGLGLSLSYDIIKAHNGTIEVRSSEGEFTEFIIQLPN